MEAYWAWHQKSMEGKVFADNRYAKGWYRNDRGINWTLWPTGLVQYWLETRKLDISDYTLKYQIQYIFKKYTFLAQMQCYDK